MIFSPIMTALGARCRFYPTCSEYALRAFETHNLSCAFKLSLKRVFKCGPWHLGGLDEVPKRI